MASETVLVVEDDTDLRESVVALLEAEGLTARDAADGDEALAALRDGLTPSVILLDLTMPRVDGWRFRVQQTLDPRLAAIPVIVVSGHWNAREAATILGAEAVVRKPLDVDGLLAAVQDVCLHRCPPGSNAVGRRRPPAVDSPRC